MTLRRPDAAAAIYVHIPFCNRLCPYCDFAVAVRREPPHAAYADALTTELDARRADLEGRTVRSLYFGGGTPSLWDPEQLLRFTRGLTDRVTLAADAEVTLEANPTDVDRARLRFWRDEVGINRLSLGVQSFDDATLDRLGRNHDAARAHAALGAALDVLDDVSIDLIFAAPSQPGAAWRADLATLQEQFRGVSHVSTYHLTIEPNTVFARRDAAGELDLPDEDAAVAMMDETDRVLSSMGLEHYEVSSYGRPGHWSRHNSAYWTGAEYLGLGVGAHSLTIDDRIVRRANPRRLRAYLERPTRPAEVDDVPPAEHLAERIFLGARTQHGIDLEALRDQLGDAVGDRALTTAAATLERFVGEGLLERSGDRFKPTPRGLRFADTIAEAILA